MRAQASAALKFENPHRDLAAAKMVLDMKLGTIAGLIRWAAKSSVVRPAARETPMARIVHYIHRYKRPPRKRKPQPPLPAWIVTAKLPKRLVGKIVRADRMQSPTPTRIVHIESRGRGGCGGCWSGDQPAGAAHRAERRIGRVH